MPLNLNPSLNAEKLAGEYGKDKRIQIRDIFPPEQAEEIYRDLASKTPWGLFYRKDGKGDPIPADVLKTLPPEKIREINEHIFQTARSGYQFMYFFNALSETNCPPGPRVLEFKKAINSEPVLEFIRTVTGIRELTHADGQATRYIGNYFLHPHSDEQEETGRRVAYVLNMTKGWNPDWGGFLQFFDENLNIVKGFVPTFNALNLFTVPQGHSVSCVAPFCSGERLSITGWFRDN